MSSCAEGTPASSGFVALNRQHSQQEIEAARQLIEHSQSECNAYHGLAERANGHRGDEENRANGSETQPDTSGAEDGLRSGSPAGAGPSRTEESPMNEQRETAGANAGGAGQMCR